MNYNDDFFEEMCFRQKIEGSILDVGNTVGPKSRLNPRSFSSGGRVSASFISFEKYELQTKILTKIFEIILG